jgi:hypothetical protein
VPDHGYFYLRYTQIYRPRQLSGRRELTSHGRVEPSSPGAVLERLERIETLLQTQGLRLDSVMQSVGLSSDPGIQRNAGFSHQPPLPASSPPNPFMQTLEPSTPMMPNRPEPTRDAHLDPAFLVPVGHTASTGWLLNCAPVKALLGDYPRDYFYDLEERLPLPRTLNDLSGSSQDWPALDAATLDQLAHNYFSVAHPHFPIFTVQEFEGWQAEFFRTCLDRTPETAICLCVYAIGSLVSPEGETISTQEQAEKDALGLRFFHPALNISWRHAVWGFRPEISVVRALLLCASYLAHIGRPLHSWKLAYHTSINFIQLLDK